MNNKNKSVYVFNSAFNPLYQRNLLKTLALPQDYVNRVRYTRDRNVPPYFDVSIDKLRREYRGLLGAFIFVDRYDKYKFYPIRMIKITDFDKRAGKLFIYYQVKDYLYAKNPLAFHKAFWSEVKDGPKLTNADPLNIKDGNYCVVDPNILDKPFLDRGNNWKEIVNQISATQAYKDFQSDKDYLYIKINGLCNSKNSIISPALSNDKQSSIYKLKRGEKYKISGDWRYPYTPYRQNKIEIKFNEKITMFAEDAPEIVFSGSGDKFEFPFCISKYPESDSTSIDLVSKKEIAFPDVGLNIQIGGYKTVWIIVAFILLGLVESYQESLSSSDILAFICSFKWTLVAAKYLIFFALFRTFGKRIF